MLITVVHGIANVTDTYGGVVRQVDEATVDIVDLDVAGESGYPELRERIKLSHVGIVNRLVAGRTMILGRIGQVPTDKGNPAYVLNGFDEAADAPRAAQWAMAWQQGLFNQATVAAPAAVVPVAPQVIPQAPPVVYPPQPVAPQPAYPQTVAPQVPQAAPVYPPQPAAPLAAPVAPQVDQAALAALLGQLPGAVVQG